jgi:P-type conjugative transfer protein TrbJ
MQPCKTNIKKIIMLSLLIIFPPASFAILVVDVATEINTAITYAKEIEAIKHQLEQLDYERKNLAKLSHLRWDNAQSALDQLADVVNKSYSLAYSMADIDQQFRKLFPGYNQQATTDYAADYKNWVRTTQATMNGILDQVNESYKQIQEEATFAQMLADQAKKPTGRLQAVQIGIEIAAEQIAQIQKLKATMMAQANAQAEYYAYQSQKDAAQQQSVDAVVKNADFNFPSYQGDLQFGLIPKFSGGN